MATNAKGPRANNAKPAPSAASLSLQDAETKGLKVVPKRDGFRRGGYAFPAEGLTIPIIKLSPEQYEQITNEPMLISVVVDLDIEAVAEKAE